MITFSIACDRTIKINSIFLQLKKVKPLRRHQKKCLQGVYFLPVSAPDTITSTKIHVSGLHMSLDQAPLVCTKKEGLLTKIIAVRVLYLFS